MTYTTTQLIAFIEQEMKAGLNGDRVFVLPDDADQIVGEVGSKLGDFLGAARIMSIANYHDYREQVWRYQLENNVSGLITKQITLGGKVFEFPEPHSQLTVVGDDMEVLKGAKDLAVAAFVEFCQSAPAYLYHTMTLPKGGEWNIQTTPEWLLCFAQDCEWAILQSFKDGIDGIQASICLGWGDPNAAHCVGNNDADCLYFHAQTVCRNANEAKE